jgi:hypothetical protein
MPDLKMFKTKTSVYFITDSDKGKEWIKKNSYQEQTVYACTLEVKDEVLAEMKQAGLEIKE